MTHDFKITLDIAQIMLLGGLIAGLVRMSAAVDGLKDVTRELTDGLKVIGASLASIVTRVSVLEDRDRR